MFLITTSYKKSWGNKSENILFAREWCKLFSNKKYWEDLNYEVFPYHWLDRNKLYADIQNLDDMYEKYLDIMVVQLNNLHNVKHTNRYWRIIIGPWLNEFIRLIFDYYSTVQDIKKSKLVTDTHIIDLKVEEQIPQNFISFHESYSSPIYNHYLFGEIIKYTTSIPYKTIYDEESDIAFKIKKKSFIEYFKRGIKYLAAFLYSSLLIPNNYKKIIFVSSYFSNQDLNYIQKKLNQLPMTLLFDPTALSKKANLKLRKRIAFKHPLNDFEKLLNNLIPVQIPIAYIENYRAYNRLASLFFPKKPKAIFTATAYYYNEAFKFWSAKATVGEVKLLFSQHGGGTGTSLWNGEEKHMIDVANIFYTWGWSDGSNKTRKMPANKLTYTQKNITNGNPQGDILCVTNSDIINYSHSQFPMPNEAHFLDYIKDIFSISDLLNEDSKKYLKYRLYHTNYNRASWGIEHKFIEKNLDPFLDTGNVSFNNRLNECRLAIIVYGQNTTVYETLSANFPTMLYWNPDHWELRDKAKPYFNLLKKCGIFHTSADSLCDQINKVYDDVDSWWLSEDTQKAVKIFCNEYAFTKENYIEEWFHELNNHIS